MSYIMTGGTLDGDFGAGSTKSMPVTISIWIKRSSTLWALTAEDCAATFGDTNTDSTDSHRISTNNAADSASAVSDDGTNSPATKAWTSPTLDDVWIPITGVFTNNSLRDIWIDGTAYNNSNTGVRSMGDALRYVRIGTTFDGFNQFNGIVSDLCIWDGALSETNIALLRSGSAASGEGPNPSTIDNANCIGYWSLRGAGAEPANWPDESGNGGPTLTMTGTDTVDYTWQNVAVGDDPTITSASTNETVYPFTGPWR